MPNSIQLTQIGKFDTGLFDKDAAEIPAYDPISQRLFVVNGETRNVDVLDLSDPSNPTFLFAIDNANLGGSPNSVDIKNGIVAIAVENDNIQAPGQVLFLDADGNIFNSVTVGALPDNLTFTPDGKKILVANEGELNEDNPENDPDGSISIIDISNGVDNPTVTTVDFTAFNGQEDELRSQGIRIFPDKTFGQDAEPEYISVSADGKTAFVTLQENNTVAVIDIETGVVTDLQPLGVQDYSQGAIKIDVNDKDGQINLQNKPVFGLFQPDTIATYEINGETYYVTANEGSARDEDVRIKDLKLDPTAFPNAAELQQPENLGRLQASSIDGDIDGDGDIDKLFIFGGRSFSIRDSQGNLVFDSGDQFARIIAEQTPQLFNSGGTINTFDQRSDNKGAEPEAVEIGEIDGRIYAFIGIERVGGVMVYDVTNPTDAQFVQYINPLDEEGNALDLEPEGLEFISAENSPNGQPLLAVANALSGTTTIYQIQVPGLLIEGAEDNEQLNGGTGNDTIDGGKGNDTIIGGAGDDTIDGGKGNDTIVGGKGDDLIKAGQGNDLLYGVGGSDTLVGGKGNDFFQIDLVSGGGSQIRDRDGNETLLITNNIPVGVLTSIEGSEIDELNNTNLAEINLSAPKQGVIGLGKEDSNLIIDLNQDGILTAANDLTINKFFNRSGTGEGSGFIEEINNLKGEDILEFFTEGED